MYETVESLRSKAETHKAMGGKVNIYRREHSDKWQCSTFLNGRNWRVSTHENSLGPAKVFAEDWYLVVFVIDSQFGMSPEPNRGDAVIV